ncbi:MAG: NAD(P)H-dependent oxidoreductase [Prochlorococcus sp.]
MPSASDLLVITASNGENLKLAERFAQIGNELGAKPELLDLTTLDLPLFNPRTEASAQMHSVIGSLSQQLAAVPRWVICSPEYNGSIPPVLTSAMAWLTIQGDDFRSLFNGRPIALATFSGGGGLEVLIAMRLQLVHLGAQVVGRQLVSNPAKPAKDTSIHDLLQRLLQMQPLNL